MEIKATIINGNPESQKLVLQANIPFTYLIEKVRFTHMKSPEDDPMSEGDEDDKDSEKFYQRRIDRRKIESLKKHIRKSILNEHIGRRVSVLFPTALLLAISGDVVNPRIDKELYLHNIHTPDSKFYIADGQHRMWAMRELYKSLVYEENIFGEETEDTVIKKYLDKFRFNCTILLNFDLWEQAQIFADINFNQKKVDKSLYYSIYGLLDPNSIDDVKSSAIFVAHTLVKLLNKSDQSVLQGLIRMLGNGKGLVSQAFIADSIIRNLRSPRGIWYSRPEEVQDRIGYYAFELTTFFSVIKSMYPESWPKFENGNPIAKSIITKTTGMGALLRLFVHIHRLLMGDSDFGSLGAREYLTKHYISDAGWLLSGMTNKGTELFGFFGEYSGTGGKGLESRLYNRMLELIKTPLRIHTEKKTINNVEIQVTFTRDMDNIFSFSLSKYFKNPDQMQPYRPGSGSMATSMYHLRSRLNQYISQIHPNAIAF